MQNRRRERERKRDATEGRRAVMKGEREREREGAKAKGKVHSCNKDAILKQARRSTRAKALRRREERQR